MILRHASSIAFVLTLALGTSLAHAAPRTRRKEPTQYQRARNRAYAGAAEVRRRLQVHDAAERQLIAEREAVEETARRIQRRPVERVVDAAVVTGIGLASFGASTAAFIGSESSIHFAMLGVPLLTWVLSTPTAIAALNWRSKVLERRARTLHQPRLDRAYRTYESAWFQLARADSRHYWLQLEREVARRGNER